MGRLRGPALLAFRPRGLGPHGPALLAWALVLGLAALDVTPQVLARHSLVASTQPHSPDRSTWLVNRELLSNPSGAKYSTVKPLATSGSTKSPPKSPTKSPAKSPPKSPAKSPPVSSPKSPPKSSSPPKTSAPPAEKKPGLIKRLLPKRKKKAESGGPSGPNMVNLADAQKIYNLVMSLSKQKQFVGFFQKAGLLPVLLEAMAQTVGRGATFLVPSPDALQALPPASPYINKPSLARTTLRYHMIIGQKFDYTQLVEFNPNRKFATLAKEPVFKSDASAFFTVVFRSGSGRSTSTMVAPNLANTTTFQLHLVDTLLIPDDVYKNPPPKDDGGDDDASPPPPSPSPSPPKSPPPPPSPSPSPPVVSSPSPPVVTPSPPVVTPSPPVVTPSPPPPVVTPSPPVITPSPPPPVVTPSPPPPVVTPSPPPAVTASPPPPVP